MFFRQNCPWEGKSGQKRGLLVAALIGADGAGVRVGERRQFLQTLVSMLMSLFLGSLQRWNIPDTEDLQKAWESFLPR